MKYLGLHNTLEAFENEIKSKHI